MTAVAKIRVHLEVVVEADSLEEAVKLAIQQPLTTDNATGFRVIKWSKQLVRDQQPLHMEAILPSCEHIWCYVELLNDEFRVIPDFLNPKETYKVTWKQVIEALNSESKMLYIEGDEHE